MPEIAESELMNGPFISFSFLGGKCPSTFADNTPPVARAVHFLRLHLVGKTIKSATAVEDGNVFGKVGTTGPEFAAAMTGKKVGCFVALGTVNMKG